MSEPMYSTRVERRRIDNDGEACYACGRFTDTVCRLTESCDDSTQPVLAPWCAWLCDDCAADGRKHATAYNLLTDAQRESHHAWARERWGRR